MKIEAINEEIAALEYMLRVCPESLEPTLNRILGRLEATFDRLESDEYVDVVLRVFVNDRGAWGCESNQHPEDHSPNHDPNEGYSEDGDAITDVHARVRKPRVGVEEVEGECE